MWDELSLEDNVLFINQKLSSDEGLTMKYIEEKYYKVNERTIVKRLDKKGYKRSKEGKKLFVLVDEEKANRKPNSTIIEGVNVTTKETTKAITNIDTKQTNKTTIEQLTDEEIKQIRELLANNKNNDKGNDKSNDIEVGRVVNGQVRSWRISTDTIKKFNKFSQKSKYGSGELINQAILEYMENHK